MQLIFDSVDEVVDFVKNHLSTKARKGGKGGDEADAGTAGAGGAPAPIMPNTGGMPQAGFPQGGAAGFAPQAAGATQMGGGFPVQGAPTVAPEVQALVSKIVTGLDSAIANGQPADKALEWFRGECAKVGMVQAAGADLNQIKAFFLPQMNVQALANIAALMGIK